MVEAGVGAINVSWWGRGSYEDRAVHLLMDVMRAHRIHVTFHLEPVRRRPQLELRERHPVSAAGVRRAAALGCISAAVQCRWNCRARVQDVLHQPPARVHRLPRRKATVPELHRRRGLAPSDGSGAQRAAPGLRSHHAALRLTGGREDARLRLRRDGHLQQLRRAVHVAPLCPRVQRDKPRVLVQRQSWIRCRRAERHRA